MEDGTGMLIGALAEATGVTAETIRYYEKERILPAPRRSGQGKYRRYAPAEVQRLRFVRRARDLGFSLDDVRGLLSLSASAPDAPCDDVDGIAQRHIADIDAKIAHLRALRGELARLLKGCDSRAGVGNCRLLAALSE